MTLLYTQTPSDTKNHQTRHTNDYTKQTLMINVVTYKKYVYKLIIYGYQNTLSCQIF